MKINEQTRKLAAGYSKYSFEVANKTDEVSSKHFFEVADMKKSAQDSVLRLQIELTKSVNIYCKVKLTWFEEIFEEY
ncbi:hypothetical protein [Streptococcus pneumoniae]|uniref:hypothetical protein n=1 Tax=Streptococcus pneumoniae TaxID=1313 RepID=UPI00067C27EA|nr:hypothetical protein [Streptococcus pneumoniae]